MKVTELNTVDDIRVSLDDHHYIANRSLSISIRQLQYQTKFLL